MMKLKHAYKAGTSLVGFVWYTIWYYIYKVLYRIFRIIYHLSKVILKLSFFIGAGFLCVVTAFFIKEYYPPHYSVMQCIKLHFDAGYIDSSYISKFAIYIVLCGAAFFSLSFLITHMVASISQWINDKVIHTEEIINGYENSAKNHSTSFRSKNLSDAQIIEMFKKSDNYVSPRKKFGIKKTATEYYNL